MLLGGDGARTKAGAIGTQRRDPSKPPHPPATLDVRATDIQESQMRSGKRCLEGGNEGDEVTGCG